jgi:hypothetical protein
MGYDDRVVRGLGVRGEKVHFGGVMIGRYKNLIICSVCVGVYGWR